MSTIANDCPRCGTQQVTFDVWGELHLRTDWSWQRVYELFCCCRKCHKSTVFVVRLKKEELSKHIRDHNDVVNLAGDITSAFHTEGFINVKDLHVMEPPEHLPPNIKSAFVEGATCYSVGCYNAAATMFRLCLDLATKPLLPPLPENAENASPVEPPSPGEPPPPNEKTRRDLGLRLPWLFKNGTLPADLGELASCIHQDGNDGAHAGTLKADDAADILEFTSALLERLFTQRQKVELAKSRRLERRAAAKNSKTGLKTAN